jgi:(R,R)-butanediol dehydrogenase/meso-butanediol dehydrogenase/diacetyl reductase
MWHEFSGEVVEVGGEVRGKFRPGDRVTAVPGIGCGSCSDCLSGDVMHCAALEITGLGQLPGAYAQYVRVGSNESVRLPESVDFPLGALVEPLAVGLHAVKAAALEPGQDVLVMGAGPIGLAVILWSRFLGARHILVSEPANGRRAMATALGATAVAEGTDAAAEILADRPGGGADIIFECVGKPGLLAQSVKDAAPRSKVVVAGICMRPDNFVPGVAVVKELRLEFVLAYHKADFQLTLDMLDAGRIDPWPMVTDRIDLAGLPQVFEALKNPADQCKVLVEF